MLNKPRSSTLNPKTIPVEVPYVNNPLERGYPEGGQRKMKIFLWGEVGIADMPLRVKISENNLTNSNTRLYLFEKERFSCERGKTPRFAL